MLEFRKSHDLQLQGRIRDPIQNIHQIHQPSTLPSKIIPFPFRLYDTDTVFYVVHNQQNIPSSIYGFYSLVYIFLMETHRRVTVRILALMVSSLAFFQNVEVRTVDAFTKNVMSYKRPHQGLLSLSKKDVSLEASHERILGVIGNPSSLALNPIEAWCITHMDVMYSKSLSIKCPFLRRRMADFLDGLDMVMRFLVIRHKSLPLIGPPPGCRSLLEHPNRAKIQHLELSELIETIRHDWKSHNHKGYYITGRLNTTIYRDDCFFDGPDPDMPVKGLRKYLNAASQLFDTATSTAELISLQLGEVKNGIDESSTILPKDTYATIVARWRLQGVLHLPWHPSLPTWTGTTVYHLDENHLIYRHEEFWDISVLQAFMQTLWPQVGNRIWHAPTDATRG